MDTRDLALRNLTYAFFVELGQAPSAEEVVERACTTEDDVVEGWKRLHDQSRCWWTAGRRTPPT